MHTLRTAKTLLTATLLAFLLAPAHVRAEPNAAARGVLPEKVGERTSVKAPVNGDAQQFRPEDFLVTSSEARHYAGPGGENFFVRAFKTASASAAYSLLRHQAGGQTPARVGTIEGLGLIGVAEPARLRFVKGDTFVDIRDASAQAKGLDVLRAFAGRLAESLEGAPGELPVLVLHLPEWEKKVNEDLGFAVSTAALQHFAGHRPALDVVDFGGGAEAVTATYDGGARLVIVEFTTPQHAFDTDALINQRIAELRAAGQPVPSVYKRVGNYSVFVFDAAEAGAAERLAARVKYEKDVRWLGRNPRAEEIIARRYTSTMGGVIITTLITTGVAILLCLGVGGIIGGAIFLRRRARISADEIYSDAGGMLRLNLEDLNTQPASTKLLGGGKD